MILLLLVLMPAIAAFADEDEPPLLMLEEPQPDPGSAVTIITREQIERSQAVFVLDLLRAVPGLHIAQAGSAGKETGAFGRGAGPELTQVWIDGARLNGALLPIDLAHLTTTGIERIEITRGPRGAPLGSSAMGAVIRIFTRYAGPLISGRAEYGSDQTRRGAIRAGVGSSANHLALAVERYDTDGQKAGDDYRNDTISARAKVMVTSWTSLALEFHDTDTDGGIPNPEPSLPSRHQSRTRLISVPIRQQIGSWFFVEARFSHLKQELNEDHSRTQTFSVSGHLRKAREHDLVAGYEQEDFETRWMSTDLPDVKNKAFFAEYRFQPEGPWSALASVRWDDDSIFESRFSPRFSAAYRIQPAIQLRGSIGTGFRRPTPQESATLPASRDLVTGFDLGAEVTTASAVTVAGSFFHNRFKHEDLSSATTVSSFNASGMELEVTCRQWKGIQPHANYTLTDTEDQSPVPRHSGYVGIAYSWNDLALTFDWYIKGQTPSVDSYNRADFVASYRLPWGLEAYGRVTNAFDSLYSEVQNRPAPDRAFYFGIRYH